MSSSDVTSFERDPEDVACDLDRCEVRSAKAGSVEAAALYGEAANWIRHLVECLDAWENEFFGHTVPPKVARRMVEDRAKSECWDMGGARPGWEVES